MRGRKQNTLRYDNGQKTNSARGRPKTLNRDQVLQSAVTEYWSKGPTAVSIGDLCGLTGVSKPGVFREFGSDDGLKMGALESYRNLAMQPLIDILEKDQPAAKAVPALIRDMTQDRAALGVPQGCLFVMMRAHSQHLGAATGKTLHEVRRDLLVAYEARIERSKARGEFADIPTHVAALVMDAQHGGAMRMQREHVHNDIIATVLTTALGMLVLEAGDTEHRGADKCDGGG